MLQNKLVLVCLFSLFGSLCLPDPFVNASDVHGKFAVRGAGAGSCQQLLAGVKETDEKGKREVVIHYMSWIDGYLSYINRVEKNTFDVVPLAQSQDVLAVVVSQCGSQPNALVETVLLQVIVGFSKAKVQNESPFVTIKAGELAGNMRKETLVAIQSQLIEHKLLKGKADGEFGKNSIKALKDFQKSVNLPETGYPDVNTIIKLLLS